jgi:hypothetical protein
MDTNFNDFLVETFHLDPEKIERFLNRQCSLRDAFKEKGVEIAWLLDLTHILFLIKNYTLKEKFTLKRDLLKSALEFAKNHEELQFEKELLEIYLK